MSLYEPVYFKQRVIDTLLQLKSNLKELNRSHFLIPEIIIPIIEDLNLICPLYAQFFEQMKKAEDINFIQNSGVSDSPFWLFEVLNEDTKMDKNLIFDHYVLVLNECYEQQDNYDRMLYYLVAVVAIIQQEVL